MNSGVKISALVASALLPTKREITKEDIDYFISAYDIIVRRPVDQEFPEDWNNTESSTLRPHFALH